MWTSIMAALLGGALIGLAASVMLWAEGRAAGISSIVGGLVSPTSGEASWRGTFIVGLLSGGALLSFVAPEMIAPPMGRTLPMLLIAGLLVGFGTRLGGGCTSGHGVCGLSRSSSRSLAATLVFMVTGALTATVMHLFMSGSL